MKSHISHVVADSKLEIQIAHELEKDDRVLAYAKNDRLFLEIPYRFLGRTLRYRPDFLVKLGDGEMLLIEEGCPRGHAHVHLVKDLRARPLT